ncbi:hypothetical protein [Chondromyces apiculatus]|uniref:Uncharacterized protein n=1 Tax=Chondromyces apiculatus DSM 436 TaxID=1192034 RepID=A0A017TD49_9BACT|nr:hypothetical protein [Chondromyces apiculatus]EYF07213.1 Hypothetical protein CAP_0692 [Chondromyces apiculatus DSM 436]
MAVRRWRIEEAHESLWLLQRSRWDGAPGDGLDHEGTVLNASAAAFQVDAWFPDGWGDAAGAATLADIAAALGEERPWHHDIEARQKLKGIVRQALREGRLVAVQGARLVPRAGSVDEEEAAADTGPRREESAWIEIVLTTDDDPQRPVAFRRYRVELPDGSVREGRLDARGAARLAGIDPGTCQVSFPDFDGKRWRRA